MNDKLNEKQIEQNKEKKKIESAARHPMAAFCSILGTILLIIIILACIPFTLPKVMNYQAYTIISGSMEPAIPTGSLVYVKNMEPQNVAIDDVIAYYGGPDTSAIITHRVVENRVVMGEFITKGDANEEADMNPTSYREFIGRVELSIPNFGIVAQFMTSREGKIAAGCMIGFAITLHLIATVLDKGAKKN